MGYSNYFGRIFLRRFQAGQESFRSITRSYYRGSICAFLIFDITKRNTFTNISKWLKETKEYANEKILIFLIGNKIDLENERFLH